MIKNVIRMVLMVLLILMPLGISAQDDYNPSNPPEPHTRYKLTTTAAPEGYTSGSGMYLEEASVWISTSAYNQNYKFLYWTLNGEYYSDVQSFYYTMPADKAVFVAVYEYDPVDPLEPVADYVHRLFLKNNITEACSFNRSSGAKVKEDSYVTVTAYVNSGYDFLGWYENGRLVSETTSFNYYMGTENVTLEARFAYNPINPDEPVGSPDVDNGLIGDVDGDGVVDISDKVLLVKHYLGGTTSVLNKSVSDVNGDSEIDITDAVEIVNKYLNSK